MESYVKGPRLFGTNTLSRYRS